MASFYSNCYCVHVSMCTYIYIPKDNLFSPHNATCMYVSRADHLALDWCILLNSLELQAQIRSSFYMLRWSWCLIQQQRRNQHGVFCHNNKRNKQSHVHRYWESGLQHLLENMIQPVAISISLCHCLGTAYIVM